jgi:pimeloyl-ACP methyl ester carboxylesterase
VRVTSQDVAGIDTVHDRTLRRPDGRTVAWTECGATDGRPLLRVPGTPGCRWTIRADRSAWHERNLRVITTERPGFGASTPLPGRGFAEHADDLAAILDHNGIERVHVHGASGAAPHILAFAARHPDRVRAVTILAGAAPLSAEEEEQIIPINQEARRLARASSNDALRAFLEPIRLAQVADPLATIRQIMSSAPAEDHDVMSDEKWQQAFVRATKEALGSGVQGWLDETLAICGDWSDVDVAAVRTSVVWYHTSGDRNAPLSAAQRLVEQLPNATLTIWPDGGHLAGYRREPEILDNLLSRS